MQPLKLFVVGESSGNPELWGAGYALVIAKDADEARALAGDEVNGRYVAEVDMTKPILIAVEPVRDWPV